MLKIVEKLALDKVTKEDVKKKYKDKEKVKKLTVQEQVDRIEEYLGIKIQ